jgi:hypothetical protein
MRKWLSVVALLVAACDRGAGGGSGPDCTAAATALVASLASKDTGSDAQQTKPALASLCTADKWSPEARSCIVKATTREAQQDCWYKQLTGEQADKLKKASAPLRSSRAAMKKFHEFADKMCACKDMTCAQDVSDEMTKWGQEMAKTDPEPPVMTEEDTKEATALGQRMGECMQKAMGVADPAAPAPANEGDIDPRTGNPISK